MFAATATLVYDPPRHGLRKARDRWWCIAEVDGDLSSYYRWLWQRETGRLINKPAWQPHITVTGDIEPPMAGLWGRHVGEMVAFEYLNDLYELGPFVGLTVRAGRLNEIRAELGLPSEYPFHITLGRLADR